MADREPALARDARRSWVARGRWRLFVALTRHLSDHERYVLWLLATIAWNVLVIGFNLALIAAIVVYATH